jgi:flagellar motor switch/type III secretory pathway protein FliN
MKKYSVVFGFKEIGKKELINTLKIGNLMMVEESQKDVLNLYDETKNRIIAKGTLQINKENLLYFKVKSEVNDQKKIGEEMEQYQLKIQFETIESEPVQIEIDEIYNLNMKLPKYVQVVLNNVCIAKGEVYLVEENYAVMIKEICVENLLNSKIDLNDEIIKYLKGMRMEKLF